METLRRKIYHAARIPKAAPLSAKCNVCNTCRGAPLSAGAVNFSAALDSAQMRWYNINGGNKYLAEIKKMNVLFMNKKGVNDKI